MQLFLLCQCRNKALYVNNKQQNVFKVGSIGGSKDSLWQTDLHMHNVNRSRRPCTLSKLVVYTKVMGMTTQLMQRQSVRLMQCKWDKSNRLE